MIDYEVLEAFDTTNARLREVFTAEADPDDDRAPEGESKADKEARLKRKTQRDADIACREKWRRKIQSRLQEGVNHNFKHWKLHAALDMAWDTNTLSGVTIPLSMYAQGKIKMENAVEQLKATEQGQKFLREKEGGGMEVDVPRFVESNVNIIRSIIGRRHAAQKNKFSQLFPYYEYNPRGTRIEDKCRADVLSQRVEIISDQYAYRHHDSQVFLDSLLHGPVLDFVSSSWDSESQLQKKAPDAGPEDPAEVIVREGVGWFNPDPTRTFVCNTEPMVNLNTDTVQNGFWLGFWDIFPFRYVDDNPAYFNKTRVGYTGRLWEVFDGNRGYFNYYAYTLVPPAVTAEVNPAKENDRVANIGMYSGIMADVSVFVCNYYEKVVPKDWGLGNYPWPVWVRLVVASDSTVIFAEIMPSTPAAVLAIGARDNRQVNVSMAMDLLSYQDHMTNLCTHMLMLCQVEEFKVIGLNTDLLTDKQIQEARRVFESRNWFQKPQVLEFSPSKLADLGIQSLPQNAVSITETRVGASISSIFDAMIRLVELAEKLTAMSPAEQGQPAPREISATEVTEIANTTSSVYTAISIDIDEYRAAKKRIIYESLIACAKADIYCPVKDRYTAKTIVAAGFKPFVPNGSELSGIQAGASRQMVMGSKHNLVHDYVFTSRDGSERPVNTQAANTLVQLISQILAVPLIAQALGKEKLYNLFNEVFRMSGAGVDLLLELKDGEDDSLGQDEIAVMKQTIDKLTEMLQQMAGQIQQVSQGLQQQEQVNAEQQQLLDATGQLAKQFEKLVMDVQKMQQEKAVAASKAPVELLKLVPYKDAPDPVKRQIESTAGFEPAIGSVTPQPQTTTK